MLQILSIALWGSGAFLFLLIGILTAIIGEKAQYADHDNLLKHVNAILTCIAFMLTGIGVQVLFR